MEIVVVAGPDTGKHFSLSTSVRTIGRDTSSDLPLSDVLVSARHAVVRPLSNASVEISDMSSTNGTWVNGVRATEPVEVGPNDTFQIGHNMLRVFSQDSPNDLSTHRTPRPPPARQSALPSIQHAGPVAGGNIDMSGRQVAGRDLHYHEGFRIRSRMGQSAKRVLRWGVFLMFTGFLIGLGAVVAYSRFIFGSTDSNSRDGFDFQDEATTFAVAGAGMLVIFVGLVLIITSLLMRRERIREPIATHRR